MRRWIISFIPMRNKPKEPSYNFRMRLRLLFLAAILAFLSSAFAQDQPAPPEPRKYVPVQVRLAEAKNVFLRNAGGTDIPFNVIQAGIESWPRYTIVDSPEKADLIIEVQAPEDTTSSSVGANVSTDTANAHARKGTEASHDFAPILMIKLNVMDAKTKVLLFSATERPKNAWKENNRTESQIECAQKLLAAFHNRVEPPPPAETGTAPQSK